jgi:hypothetical protein
MLNRICFLAVCTWFACLGLTAQEATFGLSVPITISGDTQYTHGPATEYSGATSRTAGFRAVVSPALRLGPHWFVYSALDVHSSSYLPYGVGSDEDQRVQFDTMQAFVGYTTTVSGATLLLEAGQLSSAFGLFPLQYDDAKLPLINPPPVYTASVPLRPDQLPCGVENILRQTYESNIDYKCGGAGTERYGLAPATLYGLPSIEAQVSLARFDARLQVTNSSPANPQSLRSSNQFAQWTAGGGYTFRGGLHVGVSGFRGPYLDKSISPFLPAGTTIRNFPASGLGMDAQWSRGAWSLQGEWQHFHFDLPGFVVSPSLNAEYAQVKRIVSPRLFLAARAAAQHFGRIADNSGVSASHFTGPRQVYELTAGYHLNRQQLLKVGAGWTNRNAWSATGWFWPRAESYMFELQLVTSVTAVSKAFR